MCTLAMFPPLKKLTTRHTLFYLNVFGKEEDAREFLHTIQNVSYLSASHLSLFIYWICIPSCPASKLIVGNNISGYIKS